MALPGTPQNFNVQSANQQILVSWALSSGATAYIVQRSLDGVTFSTIATMVGSPQVTSYLDTTVTLGTSYTYQVTASSQTFALAADTQLVYYSNGLTWTQVTAPNQVTGLTAYSTFSAFPSATLYTGAGLSPYTTAQTAVPAPTGEMCLSQIRLAAQQRADRVNSQFVTQAEWRNYINQAMFELYDLLVTVYEDYFIATPVQFVVSGTTSSYPLPNGTMLFNNPYTGQPFVAPPFYKALGVDLAVNNTTNAYVTVDKFNFSDRNNYVYPNSTSAIYGVFNIQYRIMGQNIQFIPLPSGGQAIRLWYIPRLVELLNDNDITQMGISGWIEYVIVRAAKYALDKEESDTTILTQEIAFLKQRIEESAANRDAGRPDTISDVIQGRPWGSGGGRNGSSGGF